MKVKSESEVAQSCPTLSDPTDCSLPGSSIHGIFQARVLEWVAIAFSTPPSEVPIICHLHPTFKIIGQEDFAGVPAKAKALPSNAGSLGSIPGRGVEIPHTS